MLASADGYFYIYNIPEQVRGQSILHNICYVSLSKLLNENYCTTLMKGGGVSGFKKYFCLREGTVSW